MGLELRPTGAIQVDIDPRVVQASAVITVPANKWWKPSQVFVGATTGVHAGNRKGQVRFKDPSGTIIQLVDVNLAYTADADWFFSLFPTAAASAAFVNTNYASWPMPSELMLAPGCTIEWIDVANIAPANDSGTATASSATTMTKAAAGWTVNQWSGFIVNMGGAQAVIVSNSATVLTVTAPWDPLVAGTAEASDATTMTDDEGDWTVNQWAGYTVLMDGSTATIISNTATVLTFAAWAPLAPSTGAYSIFGAYTIGGADTIGLSVAAEQYELFQV